MQTATTAGMPMGVPATASSRPSITDAGTLKRLLEHGHRTCAEVDAKRRPWTGAESKRLIQMAEADARADEIGAVLGRSVGSINARIRALRAEGAFELKRRTGPARLRPVVCKCGAKMCAGSKTCLACRPSRLRRMPDDFAEVGPTLTVTRAAVHFQTTYEVAKRWYAEAGIAPSTQRHGERRAGARSVVRRTRPQTERARNPVAEKLAARAAINRVAHQPAPQRRHLGSAGRAAEHLQRLGPVFRCTERGAAGPQGTHWRRGSAILTDAEIIERAEAKGWKADAWSALPTTDAARLPA